MLFDTDTNVYIPIMKRFNKHDDNNSYDIIIHELEQKWDLEKDDFIKIYLKENDTQITVSMTPPINLKINSECDYMEDASSNIPILKNDIGETLHEVIDTKETPKGEFVLEPCEYQLINLNLITELPNEYPNEFNEFCLINNLNPPSITSGNGKALSVMLKYKFYYWNRDVCDKFVKKFNITTKDSIQLFNKHNQWGIQTNSGTERGKLYIVYPYCLSNKHKMRNNFKFDGTEEEKNNEIDKIKSTIQTDYVDVPNSLWQLGHKNPGSTDNTKDNLVLQPPIQAKYRDNYIFIDPLTKFPTPNKLEIMIDKKEIEFTPNQIEHYKKIFDKLFTSI
jgi:hypothetical protein